MIDPVLAGFAESDTGLLVPRSLAKRRVIPYDDLSADGIPTQRAAITPDLLSTLAILVAQGPTVPRMIRGDDAGRLRVDADLNTTALIARPQIVNDTQILLSDFTFLGAGDAFMVIPLAAIPIHGPYQARKANPAQQGLFDLTSGLTAAVAVGDSVRRFPLFGLSPADNYIKTQEETFQWDATSGTVGAGGTPLAQSPVDDVTGRIVVTWVTAYIRNSQNTLFDGELQILDPGGTKRWATNMQVLATSPVNDRYGQSGLSLKNGPIGSTWKATFSAALGAGQAADVTFGGWIQTPGF